MERSAVHSPEEVEADCDCCATDGHFCPGFQETIVHRALELNDVPIREIMTPRQRIFSVPSNMPIEEASETVIEHMHSRVHAVYFA